MTTTASRRKPTPHLIESLRQTPNEILSTGATAASISCVVPTTEVIANEQSWLRKYAPNNWRKIPVADHVNHALGRAFA